MLSCCNDLPQIFYILHTDWCKTLFLLHHIQFFLPVDKCWVDIAPRISAIKQAKENLHDPKLDPGHCDLTFIIVVLLLFQL